MRLASVLGLCALVPACSLLQSTGRLLFWSSDDLKQHELEHVAKDWCLTIRASQVIPVYPLTEDLQPGDLFLVTTPISKQQAQYTKDGFLPLDLGVARLQGLEFVTYYAGSYGIGTNTDTPHHWQFPKPPHTADPLTDWSSAPGAFFPSYSFSVSSGSGAQIAVPISAVPVGLGLMSSQSATGTVVLSDARVYGVPLADLIGPVMKWASEADNAELLSGWAQRTGSTEEDPAIYIRAISRVYLIGGVDVSLVNTDTASMGADVGAAPEVQLLESNSSDPVSWKASMDAVNAGLKAAAGAAPGGAVRLTQASRRAITARETFPRPLVVGYLGFDFPVYEDGRLGAPVLTQTRLKDEASPAQKSPPTLGQFTGDQKRIRDVRALINTLPPDKAGPVYVEAARLAGPKFAELYDAKMVGIAQATTEQIRDAFTRASGEYQMQPGMTPSSAQRAIRRALEQAWQNVPE